MQIHEIVDLVNGTLVTSDNAQQEIHFGLASDLMSDILTLEVDHAVIITGLNNNQTIRTAEVSDIHCVIIARNKKATPEMIQLANHSKITIIESPYGLFRVSGLLFQKGIKPIY